MDNDIHFIIAYSHNLSISLISLGYILFNTALFTCCCPFVNKYTVGYVQKKKTTTKNIMDNVHFTITYMAQGRL
jgi:hypothetical protein